ncbi:putative lysine decarboxylase [Microthyrium microscopicum]|uniref:Putative lysine decarboxylase n=1 Tax=Microthyrium microscopicum TaxID=703497 RepID=A0A6A6TVA0_9PEZI|nr:putative lysine decarboxylase [Microthyrium microscopicum]
MAPSAKKKFSLRPAKARPWEVEWNHKTASVVTNPFTYKLRKGLDKNPVICVFCGVSPGKGAAYKNAARELAEALHESDAILVFGGRPGGLMGEVSKRLVELSGPDSVIGVVPTFGGGPATEITDQGTSILVNNIHTRKLLMHRHVMAGGPGSGFVAMPGAFGTMDELIETTSWAQKGFINVGVVLFNVKGYYDPLWSWIDHAVSENFMNPVSLSVLTRAATASEVVEWLAKYKPRFENTAINWRVGN